METITFDQLPATIRAFNAAHEARDADAALALMTPAAVITDEGNTYSGEDVLRRFIAEAGTEFTYTDDVTGAARDGEVWVVGHHLEGNFPGGTADLSYRFALDGDRIARLDIG
ncbi:nuclear transport factor 2 family protein [Microlunatus flavus]|uniref:SnoaL-like domain-containing protein n=1 Tax=Microlunatus flavus TaxID=1036181 RepID=A0A1H9M3I8_9ACTN|nr:nuclear transport factor 2 family protein [Microlunatus flavus]SER18161.1 SnoaL-like domain-containing protein [Microlunatus flavus]